MRRYDVVGGGGLLRPMQLRKLRAGIDFCQVIIGLHQSLCERFRLRIDSRQCCIG